MDSILRSGTLSQEDSAVAAMSVTEDTINFPEGTGDISSITIIQSAKQRTDKVFRANVISNGDPLLITLEPRERFCFGMMDLAKRQGWKLR